MGANEILSFRNKKMENPNEVAPPPQPIQPPQQPKKWYQHKGLISIIVLSLVAAGTCLGYYYYSTSQTQPCFNQSLLLSQIKNYPQPDNGKCPASYIPNSLYCPGAPTWCQPDKSAVATSTQPSVASPVQSTATSSPTQTSPTSTTQIYENADDWYTYTNYQYGFYFKYPPDTTASITPFSTGIDTSPGVNVSLNYTDKTENNPYYGVVPMPTNFTVEVSPTSYTDIESWLKKYYSGGTMPEQSDIQVGGIKALSINEVVSEGGCDSSYDIFISNGFVYKIIPCLTSDPSSINTLVYKSFQLVSAQTDMSKWQTYTNSQYGFSFKHPVISSADYQPTASQEVNDYNASSTILSFRNAFYIEIQENPGSLSLKDWFEKNIDDNGILLKNGNLKLINTPNNVQAMQVDNDSNFPDEYGGDGGIHFDQWYTETQNGKYIISYNFDYQDDTLGGYGIPNDDGIILGQDILSSFQFNN